MRVAEGVGSPEDYGTLARAVQPTPHPTSVPPKPSRFPCLALAPKPRSFPRAAKGRLLDEVVKKAGSAGSSSMGILAAPPLYPPPRACSVGEAVGIAAAKQHLALASTGLRRVTRSFGGKVRNRAASAATIHVCGECSGAQSSRLLWPWRGRRSDIFAR